MNILNVFKLKRKDVDFLNGPITKGILTISVPIMVMNVIASLFTIIDMGVLKMYSSDEYTIGAIGVCGSLITLITLLLSGIFTGTNVVTARAIGSGNYEKASRSVGTSIFFSIVGGIVMMFIGVIFGKVFLTWNNCPTQLLEKATLYFRLYFLGAPLMAINNCLAAILRSTGDSQVTMSSSIVGGIAKVALTLLFVAVFGLEVAGVALATALSWGISVIWKLIVLIKCDKPTKINIKKIKYYKEELNEVLFFGVPSAFQQSLFSIANVMIASAVNSLGPDASTGVSIANNFDGILYNLCISPALAVMPFVSQNIGNKNVKRAEQAIRSGIMITVTIGVILGAMSALFSKHLSSLLSDNPAVINYSCQKMIIISSTYFICGINDIVCAGFRGLGRPILPTVSALVFLCGLRFIWVFFVFPAFPNLAFLYLVWPLGWVLSIVALIFFYPSTIRKLKEKFAKKDETLVGQKLEEIAKTQN